MLTKEDYFCLLSCIDSSNDVDEVIQARKVIDRLVEEYFELKEKYVDRENELCAEINSLDFELVECQRVCK